jgi:hypothetical protein
MSGIITSTFFQGANVYSDCDCTSDCGSECAGDCDCDSDCCMGDE